MNSENKGHSSELSFGTHLHFRIWHEDLDPDAISQVLQLPASDRYSKGDTFGKINPHTRPRGFWAISSEGQVESEDANDHVEWLMAKLEGKTGVLDELRKAGSTTSNRGY